MEQLDLVESEPGRSPKPFVRSSSPIKWLKVPVPRSVHQDLYDKCKEMKITIPEGAELAIRRWIQE